MNKNLNEEENKIDNGFRVNMTMSQELVDYYQEMAVSMGIPRSNCMIFALKTYMDQQIMLKMSQKI